MSIFDILNTVRSSSPAQERMHRMNDLNIPEKMNKPGVGTALGAVGLAGLLGAILPKGAVKSAALMGVGAAAFNFYQKWSQKKQQDQAWQSQQSQRPELDSGQFAGQPCGQAQYGRQAQPAQQAGWQAGAHQFGDGPGSSSTAPDSTAELMLRAMIYAARADGHIDEREETRITKLAEQFMPGQNIHRQVACIIEEPLNLEALNTPGASIEQKEDVYRLSCLVITVDHFMERSYIDALAKGLGISEQRQKELETEAAEFSRELDAMPG